MRDRTRRAERLADLLRQDLGELLQYEVKDPRVGFSTVTAVEVSEDQRVARVSVSAPGNEEQKLQTLEGLTAAQGFLRRQLAQRLRLRHTPALSFQLDRAQEYEQHIEELLRSVRSKP